MGQQFFLEVVRAILAAAIRMENAVLGRLTQVYGHFQRPDCQVFLHPVADCPTNDTPTEQINDDSQIKPALGGPYIADIACPFLVRRSGQEIPVQQIGGNAKVVLAIGGNLVATGANGPYPIDLHEPSHTTLAHIETRLFELHRHPGPTISTAAQGVLLADVRQHLQICAIALAGRA